MKGLIVAVFFVPTLLYGQSISSNEMIKHYDSLLTTYLDGLNFEGDSLAASFNDFVLEVEAVEMESNKKATLLEYILSIPSREWGLVKKDRLKKLLKKRKREGEIFKRSLHFIDAYEDLNEEIDVLISLGLVERNGDYDTLGYPLFISEIEFYNLSDHQRIAEVGAGPQARFSQIIFDIFQFEKLFVNELKFSRLDKVKREYKGQRDLGKIKFINGRKKTVRLEGEHLDKIIIRNSYHHFSKEDKMLQSIRESLKPEGVLYLSEPVFYLRDDPERGCIYAISRDEIMDELSRNGFILKNERVAGNYLLMKFTIN